MIEKFKFVDKNLEEEFNKMRADGKVIGEKIRMAKETLKSDNIVLTKEEEIKFKDMTNEAFELILKTADLLLQGLSDGKIIINVEPDGKDVIA